MKNIISFLKSSLKIIIVNFSVFLFCLLFVELFLLLYIKSNTVQNIILLPQFLRSHIKYNVTDVIQLKEDCTKFDKELFYTLRPGNCIFTIADSSEKYSINSKGIRDEEISLNKPEIIFLGDSYTMGWGVSSDETFSNLIRTKTNFKVLNAGISSYGTAREMSLLNRFDTSNLQYLFIQYCKNDLDENISFIKNNYEVKVSSEEIFNDKLKEEKQKQNYFLGKILYGLYKQDLLKKLMARIVFLNELKKIKTSNIEYSKASSIFKNGIVEADFKYEISGNQILHLNGWTYDESSKKSIQKIGFFLNGNELKSKLTTGIERIDLLNEFKAFGTNKLGWSAEISFPKEIQVDSTLEILVEDINGNINFLPLKNKNKSLYFKKDTVTDAEIFLKVLSHFKNKIPKNTQIVLYNLDEFNQAEYGFLKEIDLLKKSNEYPDHIQKIISVDIQSNLNREDFLRVDDHINKKGHQKVANILLDKANLAKKK